MLPSTFTSTHSEWCSADFDKKNQLQTCNSQCTRQVYIRSSCIWLTTHILSPSLQLSCGHRCPLTCHHGNCPSESTCMKRVSVRCSCKRIKKVCLIISQRLVKRAVILFVSGVPLLRKRSCSLWQSLLEDHWRKEGGRIYSGSVLWPLWLPLLYLLGVGKGTFREREKGGGGEGEEEGWRGARATAKASQKETKGKGELWRRDWTNILPKDELKARIHCCLSSSCSVARCSSHGVELPLVTWLMQLVMVVISISHHFLTNTW